MVTPENKFRIYSLFFIGIMLLFAASRETIKLYTPDSALIKISGTLEQSDMFIKKNIHRSRYNRKTISYKLITGFKLNEHQKRFQFVINQGDQPNLRQYQSLRSQLHRADSIHLWLLKTELAAKQPEIYQLNLDQKTIQDKRDPDVIDQMDRMLIWVLGIIISSVTGYMLWPDFMCLKKRLLSWRNN